MLSVSLGKRKICQSKNIHFSMNRRTQFSTFGQNGAIVPVLFLIECVVRYVCHAALILCVPEGPVLMNSR